MYRAIVGLALLEVALCSVAVLRVDEEPELLGLALHHVIPAARPRLGGDGLRIVDVLRLVP